MTEVNAIEKSPSMVRNLIEITKPRLSVVVVFSSIAGYFLGAEVYDWKVILMLIVGGYFLVGSSNVFNQIIEKDLDALMKRTRNRPLPTGRISVSTAWVYGLIMAFSGIYILYLINFATAFFGALSIILYAAVYTPLKTRTPLCVFVGAFPGAIPYMLGWVAASGNFGIEPGTLFMLQFFWQFPHFWAIGWMLEDDYKAGGFKMLPTGGANKGTAVQIIWYTVWTISISLIPAFGVTGSLYMTWISAVLVGLLGLWFLYYAIKLFKERTNQVARKLMLVSVSYITLIQIIYVVDKFLR
ncbi:MULTISPECIES: heme o synthase [Nonlabens]|uniref:Protoheme IX farnesyltransferase n=1 Tax=Nonlabens ulvanivorans TaxID=906888 RepID=A0A084JUJ4_NONUL|nr:protoheme IX farnesyltransferase [Nonlabens ulvanivorans]PRX15469.1 protoheme IX farnesyltransferase [Nonlabens ulvanivorans]GAK74535.1 heme O synthase [Nonlabens ulvanivorans]GAK98395.1 heme O synthase [Nonlabens ulvanivorans]